MLNTPFSRCCVCPRLETLKEQTCVSGIEGTIVDLYCLPALGNFIFSIVLYKLPWGSKLYTRLCSPVLTFDLVNFLHCFLLFYQLSTFQNLVRGLEIWLCS